MDSYDEELTKQRQIALNAERLPNVSFTSLAQHMDSKWLREAFARTRKDGATGIDNQTAEEYAKDLENNLASLLERAKSGTYRAPAVRRVHIPKGTGKDTRPIGIPTFEDKALQRAEHMLLEPMYEKDFLGFSHYWAKSRKGKWVVKRKTEKSRFARALKKITQWCKANRHLSLEEQQIMLNAKLRGHYAYYGITCNYRRLRQYYLEVKRIWWKWLNRRSNKYDLSWKHFDFICERLPLILPKIVHSV